MIIKAVIFDLDGLLIDSETIAKTAWAKAMSDFNFHLSGPFFARLIGVTLQDEIGMFYEEYGKDFPFDKVYARRKHYYDELIYSQGIQLKPGVLELVDFLDNLDIKKAIASSSSRDFASLKLSVSNLIGIFEIIVSGDDVKSGKPSPDIFLETANRLDCQPCECIILEDSEPGIIAAQTAGMLPIFIPDLYEPTQVIRTICPYIFRSLLEVKDFLNQRLS